MSNVLMNPSKNPDLSLLILLFFYLHILTNDLLIKEEETTSEVHEALCLLVCYSSNLQVY